MSVGAGAGSLLEEDLLLLLLLLLLLGVALWRYLPGLRGRHY